MRTSPTFTLTLLLSAALMGTAVPPAYADDDVFDDIVKMLEKPQKERDKNRHRALYSVHFDRWLKLFLNGDDKQADSEWAAVLKETRGTVDFHPLLTGLVARIHFLEDTDRERIIKRGGLQKVFQTVLTSTEHHLGRDH